MVADNQTWWTADRIQATVTPEYILKQFRPDKQKQLKQSISYGDGLTDSTYFGWILERANRLFLILEHIGVPDQIFGLVDRSYDDSHLPIPAHAIKDLRIYAGRDTSLDKKFYKAQFKYLVRDIKEGAHIRFLDDETIPVKSVGATSGITRPGKDAIDKVQLASGATKIYSRKKVVIKEPPNYLTEEEILSEITAAKRLANEHVLSVYGSYGQGNNLFTLMRPAIELTLTSFISSVPRHFENLPKPQRREILFNWPHCLAHGLAWLHSNSRHHGAIRPSNILIDSDYRIYLGQMDGFSVTQGNIKVSDIESYHYAAPERWKRAATMQKKAPTVSLHSGGRTARKQSLPKPGAPSSTHDSHDSWGSPPTSSPPDFPMDISKPTSTAYPFIPTSKGNSSRDYATSILSSRSSGTRQERSGSIQASSHQADHQSHNRMTSLSSAARSFVSSHSSDGGQNTSTTIPNSVTVAPTEVRTTVIQTWQSAQIDPLAADVFSLGAIITDIITLICKRSSAAFTKHRSAKNRTAGRGGGVADASFHANLGQVFSWTVGLQEDATKKASQEEGKIFKAVGPIIEVTRECLARSAEDRPEADVVEKSLEWRLQQFISSGTAHCKFRAYSQGGVLDTPGHSSSGVRPVPDTPARSAKEKETGTGVENADMRRSSRSTKSKSAAQQTPAKSSSLALFDFDYGQPEISNHARSSSAYTDDSTIDLQSLADRPDRIRNGTDISGWSHIHSDSRASYASLGTQAESVTETELEAELADCFFLPMSRPPLPPKQSYQPPPGRSLSPLSRAQADLSDAARKRVMGDAASSRHRSSTSDAKRGRRVIADPDLKSSRRDSVSSTDSDGQRDSDISTSERRQGRLSVSTLASNSSTIRMSWQQRDVSPMSIRDATTATSPSTSTGTHFDDKSDTDSITGQSGPYSRDRGQRRRDSSWTFDLSNEAQLHDNLRLDQVTFPKPLVANNGKEKAASPPSRRAKLQSRYASILGGRM